MANKNIFKSSNNVVETNAVNNAGGSAYSREAKSALAQLACTGTFNNTVYVSAKDQLSEIKKLVAKCDAKFIAKLAVYARQSAYMKDMPAYLAASLSVADGDLFATVFNKVADNPKMIRNIVQILRSGEVGRKSLGTRPKRLIQEKLAAYNDVSLFRGSVGNSPSLADVIKLVHPRPSNEERAAMFAYLIDKKHDASKLPQVVRDFEAFKKNPEAVDVPNVPFEMLTALPLNKAHWMQIARNATWTQTRMNLNTYARHGVFEDPRMVNMIADRLRDPKEVKNAKAFPYQLMMAFLNVETGIPVAITNALQDAMEVATENVPAFDCDNIVVANDVSGSMSSPLTGYRQGATSKATCRDVAALIASTVLRRNSNARVMPFSDRMHTVEINPRDSIMTNAKKFTINGGGTNCALPIEELVRQNAKVDLVIFASDDESWIESGNDRYRNYGYPRGTSTMAAFNQLRKINPAVKMVCIDLIPNSTVQTAPDKAILNVGGFSDQIWDVIQSFVKSTNDPNHWVKVIESIEL